MGVGGGGECGLSKEMGLGGEERLYIWALWAWWALWAMFGSHFGPICNCANFGPIRMNGHFWFGRTDIGQGNVMFA